MATVLVTGASGFVGRHLIRSLAARGDRVIATSRQPQTSAGHQDSVESRESITWRHMTEQASTKEWQSLFRQVDFVVHLAARVHVMHEEARTALSAHLKANTEFTRHLATIARDQGVSRFVFVSTIKVLGEKTLQEPFVISSNENPQDPYSKSKILAETALKKVCASGYMDYVIVRPTLVIGDGASGNLDRLIKWIASGIPIPLGGIPNLRSLLSVETLCEILARSLENPGVRNSTLLAADPDPVSTPEIVDALARGYGQTVRMLSFPKILIGLLSRAPIVGNSVSRLTESLVADSSETYERLGWRPEVSIQDRLQAVGERFRDRASS